MNYKETLFFIAKCLTISVEDRNKEAIEKQLQSNNIDWDAVVKVSTAHYVFPALYCNLKRANLLHYLPEELVPYMEHITHLNRERNEEIIKQAKELNTLLLANNITPIFLKGTGNLLAGIYDDIAERMVGDIDFIFSKEDYPRSIDILRGFGYSEVKKREYYPPEEFRHFRRLQKENNIAAIEIHSELLSVRKYANEFNYNFVEKDSQLINGVAVLSYANKLNLSIIANQINDYGFENKSMPLRNAYDVFLLSKKTHAKDAMISLDKLCNPLNCFLAACYEIFNGIDSLEYNNFNMTASYLKIFKSQLANPTPTRLPKSPKIYIFIKRCFYVLYKSITHKEYCIFLFKSLADKNWYKKKLVQFNFIKE